MTVEAEVEVTWPESRNADNLQKLERANRMMLSWNLQKELQTCRHLDFSIMKLMLNL